MRMNEPMPSQTQKAKENFLKYFSIEIANKGRVLALEGSKFEHPFVLLHGRAVSYKRLLKMEA